MGIFCHVWFGYDWVAQVLAMLINQWMGSPSRTAEGVWLLLPWLSWVTPYHVSGLEIAGTFADSTVGMWLATSHWLRIRCHCRRSIQMLLPCTLRPNRFPGSSQPNLISAKELANPKQTKIWGTHVDSQEMPVNNLYLNRLSMLNRKPWTIKPSHGW